MHALWVDFGEVSDDELLGAFRPEVIAVGETVLLYDGDGNTCRGAVECIDGKLAYLRPDWATWRTWEPARVVLGTAVANTNPVYYAVGPIVYS